MTDAVAIPTFDRPVMVQDKTLRVLAEGGIDLATVTLWVADEPQADEYRRSLRSDFTDVTVRVSAPGQNASRNHLVRQYPIGTQLLCCDDDVDDLRIRVNEKEHEPVGAAQVAALGFENAQLIGCRLWGVYPMVNPMFMKPKLSGDCRLICGPFFGVVLAGSPADAQLHGLATGEKNDYERTLRYFHADGAVARINWIGVKTRFYKNAGGMKSIRSLEAEQAAVAYLMRHWPDRVKVNKARDREYPEIRLVR